MSVITASGTGQTSENVVCVKSAKAERYGSVSATFLCYLPRSRKVAETGPYFSSLADCNYSYMCS